MTENCSEGFYMKKPVDNEALEQHRAFWANIARKHGWYVKPFHIVAWVDEQGHIRDSVSYQGLNRDMIAFE
jgi:hypothetical protein